MDDDDLDIEPNESEDENAAVELADAVLGTPAPSEEPAQAGNGGSVAKKTGAKKARAAKSAKTATKAAKKTAGATKTKANGKAKVKAPAKSMATFAALPTPGTWKLAPGGARTDEHNRYVNLEFTNGEGFVLRLFPVGFSKSDVPKVRDAVVAWLNKAL